MRYVKRYSKVKRFPCTLSFVALITVSGLHNINFVFRKTAGPIDHENPLASSTGDTASGNRSPAIHIGQNSSERFWFLLGKHLFTEEFGTFSPCQHVLKDTFTNSVEDAKRLCISIEGCTCLSRHAITGRTIFCDSSYRQASWRWTGKVFRFVWKPWRNTISGGCKDLHDERVSYAHSFSRAKSECPSIGLTGFKFTGLRYGLRCVPLWTGKTDSLQDACLRCLSTENCEVVVRQRSSLTLLCGESSRIGTSNQIQISHNNMPDVGSVVALRLDTAELAWAKTTSSTFGRIDCHAEQLLMDGIKTHSFQHAALICIAEPHCTVFSRDIVSGASRFCQGYGKLIISGPNQPATVGFKRGCERYSSEVSFSQAAAYDIPACSTNPTICPGTLFRIPTVLPGGFDLPSQLVCDECIPNGLCPVLRVENTSDNALLTETFSSMMHNVSKSLMESSGMFKNFADVFRRAIMRTGQEGIYLPINPSIFHHKSDVFVVFRITNAIRCEALSKDSTWEVDYSLRRYQSHIGFCRLSTETFQPYSSSCFRIPDPVVHDVTNFDRKLYMFAKHTSFFGPEDPRGFSFKGEIYILANIGVERKPRNGESERKYRRVVVRRIILFKLVARRPAKPIMLKFPGNGLGDEKNVVPIVSEDGVKLFLVYSIFPYKLCALNLLDGSCNFADLSSFGETWIRYTYNKVIDADTNLNALGRWRGSSPFVQTPFGYLGLIHRKQDVELGRLYTHKWILLSPGYPYLPTWMSRPFRFPRNVNAKSNDIQFASGIYFEKSTNTVVVSYGISDCLSMIGRFDIDEELKLSASRRGLQIIRPQQLDAKISSRKAEIRWEGPVSDESGYASAARAILSDLLVRDVNVSIRNIYTLSPTYQNPREYEAIYNQIIKSQADMPTRTDVTIRFHWPPNFDKVPVGKLVVYLPWEYYHIPTTWVATINKNVDELWTTCTNARRGMISSGVHEDTVFVIPHGAPQDACSKTVATLGDSYERKPSSGKPLRILYHGGILMRKGIDKLLEAYKLAFRPTDDVLLLIHGVYGDVDVKRLVGKYLKKNQRQMAKVNWIRDILTEAEIGSLYVNSDLLVHPSRSEGFGLGIVEAMAFGLPVMAPAGEPMTDFINNRNGYLIPATMQICNMPPCFNNGTFFQSADWRVPDQLRWFDFDHVHLSGKMREVYEDRNSLEQKRAVAKQEICASWSWASANELLFKRLSSLLNFT